MIIGKGTPQTMLSEHDVFGLCAEAFSDVRIDGKSVLAVIPDSTRSGPVDMMFRTVCRLLSPRVKKLDFLIALGTHPPMSDDAIYRHLGITKETLTADYPGVSIFNHNALDESRLQHIVTFSGEDLDEVTGGLYHDQVDVSVNKMVFDYDFLLLMGPTFPHETMGFSGGNKYFFPGISGDKIIDTFHWLGALVTSPLSVGRKDTPMRRLIDRAAKYVPVERLCISYVVRDHELCGLFIGSPEKAFSAAADLSEQVHIVYHNRTYERVLTCPSRKYDEIWAAGKGFGKVEALVQGGGEAILYAPHVNELSVTYGPQIEAIGYHVRDYFVEQWERFRDVPGNVLAQSCNLKGTGAYKDGIEHPRVNVTLSTGLSEELCRRINLGYCDPVSISPDEWAGREDDGVLYVPDSGEILYLLKHK
ncbi:lactate racemase domain-containing protein [Candidatus Latescibacterota bacterium]